VLPDMTPSVARDVVQLILSLAPIMIILIEVKYVSIEDLLDPHSEFIDFMD
jgi:hypothetical protein